MSSSLAEIPPALWSRLSAAPWALLMLDYDGTLAPFRRERQLAEPLPSSSAWLRWIALRTRTGVALISGRSVGELRGFLGGTPAYLAGEHGWEIQARGGPIVRTPLPHPAIAALRHAADLAVHAGWASLLEQRRAALVLHTRGLLRREARALHRACRALWAPLAPPGGCAVSRIAGGLELRARDRTKGTAVRELLAHAPAHALAVYLGDDRSDEDALREVHSTGFGVRVGATDRASCATGRLRSCGDVAIFLQRWAECARTPVACPPPPKGSHE